MFRSQQLHPSMNMPEQRWQIVVLVADSWRWVHSVYMRGSRGGGPPPPEFAKLNIANITGNEKISYFSYLCTSSFTSNRINLLRLDPLEKFSGSAPGIYTANITLKLKSSTFYFGVRMLG